MKDHVARETVINRWGRSPPNPVPPLSPPPHLVACGLSSELFPAELFCIGSSRSSILEYACSRGRLNYPPFVRNRQTSLLGISFHSDLLCRSFTTRFTCSVTSPDVNASFFFQCFPDTLPPPLPGESVALRDQLISPSEHALRFHVSRVGSATTSTLVKRRSIGGALLSFSTAFQNHSSKYYRLHIVHFAIERA